VAGKAWLCAHGVGEGTRKERCNEVRKYGGKEKMYNAEDTESAEFAEKRAV
jgi:hypothetical protein